MFETILEKLLVQYVGQFVEGIDRENLHLGFWGGSVYVQNVRVNPEILDLVELPLKIIHSHIGGLMLKVPWKSLGSSAVEIQLEDVFLIVSPLNSEEWDPTHFNNVNKRMELIDSFADQFTKKILEAQKMQDPKKKNEEHNYITKLTMRIIDNLQVTIRNIHLRFENTISNRSYAFGVTLDELLVYTSDGQGEKQFIDRLQKQFSFHPLRKKLLLKNLGIYWSSDTKMLLSNATWEMAIVKMKDLILRNNESRDELNYLIALSAESRLNHKNLKDPSTKDDPNLFLDIVLQPLDLNLEKTQLEDMIRLLDFTNAYMKFKSDCIRKQEAEIAQISEEKMNIYVTEFRNLFEKIQRSDKKDDYKGEEKIKKILVDPEEVKEFKYLIQAIPDEELESSVKEIIKALEFERQKKEIEQKKAGKGIFRIFRSKKKDNEISQEELDQLEDFLDKSLEEGFEEDLSEEFSSLKNLAISFLLRGGEISFFEQASDGTVESVTFGYKELKAGIELRNKGRKVQVSLKDINLALKSKYPGSKESITTPIIQKLELSEDESKPFIQLIFETDPIGEEDGTYIKLDWQPLEFIVRPFAIQRILSLLNVNTSDESLNIASRGQTEKDRNSAENLISEPALKPKLNISVNLAAPVIIVPFLETGDLKSSCWVLQLGDLSVQTIEADNENYFNSYNVGLAGINFKYYPSQEIYIKRREMLSKTGKIEIKRADQEEYSNIFSVLEDVSIDAKLKLVDSTMKEQAKDKPQMDICVNISGIHLKLKPQIYHYLLRTAENFCLPSSGAQMEFQERDRKDLLQGMDKIGRLYHKEKKYNDSIWVSYLVILKGGYLYFFQNSTDNEPNFVIYLKNGKAIPNLEPGREGAFIIEKGEDVTHLAAENSQEAQEWLDIITKKLTQYSLASANTLRKDIKEEEDKNFKSKDKIDKGSKSHHTVQEEQDYDLIKLSIKAVLKQLKLTLYKNDQDKLIDFETKKFSVNMLQRAGDMEAVLKLHSLKMHDYLFTYMNPHLQEFLTSKVPDAYQATELSSESVDLFEVTLKQISEDHPRYAEHNKTNLDINFKFGYLFMNIKPDVIEAVLSFLTENIPKKLQSQLQEPTQTQPPSSIQTLSRSISQNKTQVSPKNLKSDKKGTASSDCVLLRLNVQVKQVGVRMIHRSLRLCLAEFSVKDPIAEIVLKPQAKFFKGKLGNIQLLETTNYPYTIDSNIDYQKIKPYEILGVGEKGSSLIEVDFRWFDPKSYQKGDLENRVFLYLDLNVRSIRFNVLLLPLLRMISFFEDQVFGAVQAGNKSHVKLGSLEGDSEFSESPKTDKSQAEETLLDPAFMSLNVSINSPIITISPLPNSNEWIEIHLGDISVHNQQYKDTKRIENLSNKALDYVHCETIKVSVNSIGVWRVQDKNRHQLTRNFDFVLQLERLLYPAEYQVIYGEDQNSLKINDATILDAQIPPIIIVISKDDYRLFAKISAFNFNYDDGLNDIFAWTTSNTEDNYQGKSEAKVSKKQEKASKNTNETPIVVNVKLQNIGLIALDGQTQLPICILNIDLVQFNFEKRKDNSMDIQLLTHDINGSMFAKKDENVLLQRNLLGSLARESEYKIHAEPEKTVQLVIEHVEAFTAELLKRGLKRTESQLSLLVNANPDGDQTINLNLTEFRCYIVPSTLLSLGKFTSLDELVEPLTPKTGLIKSKQKPSGASKQTKKKKDNDKIPTSSISAKVLLKNIIVALPPSIENSGFASQVLTLRGDITLNFDSRPPPSLQETQKLWETKRFESITDQAAENNQIIKILGTLNEIEIFICALQDVVKTEDFSQVHKRNIVLPFSCSLLRESFSILNTGMTKLITYSRSKVELGRLVMRVSYNDFKLIFSSVNYQIEQLSQAKALPKDSSPGKKEPAKSLSSSEIQQDKRGDEYDENSAFEECVVSDQGVQFSLIDDSKDVLTPILEAGITQLAMEALIRDAKTELRGKIVLGVSYYNPRLAHWEPIIERFGLDYEMRTGSSLAPKTNVLLKTNEEFIDLNINISNDMIEFLYTTAMNWKSNIEKLTADLKEQVEKKEQVSTQDYLEYVSPYKIKNATGYPLELMAAETKEMEEKIAKMTSKYKDTTFSCGDGVTISYYSELDLERLCGENRSEYDQNPVRVQFSIQHHNLLIDPISNVDIEYNQPSKKMLKCNFKDETQFSEECYIICRADFIDNMRIFTIFSPIQLKNNLSITLHILLECRDEKIQKKLENGETAAIPFDFISEGFMAVSNPADPEYAGNRIPIHTFTTSNNSYHEISIGNKHYVIKPTKDHEITYLEFNAPFVVKNCLPLALNYQIYSIGSETFEGKLKAQETNQIFDLSRADKVFIKLRVPGVELSHEINIYSASEIPNIEKILLKDHDGKSLSLDLETVLEKHGSFKILIYCKALLINETLLDVVYYSCDGKKDTKKRTIAGQNSLNLEEDCNSKVAIYGDEAKRIAIGLRNSPKAVSDSFAINALGNQSVFLEDLSQAKGFDLGVNISILPADKEYYLFTNVIRITPRFILVNKLKERIAIKGPAEQSGDFILNQDVRTPIEWKNYKSDQKDSKKINLKILDEEDKEKWNWTGEIDIETAGIINLLARSADKQQTRFLKIQMTIEESIIFVEIDEQDPDKSSLRVQNDLEGIDIVIYQTCSKPSEGFSIPSKQNSPFAWYDPSLSRDICIDFRYGGNINYNSSTNKYSFDTINKVIESSLSIPEQEDFKIHSITEIHGDTRVMRFYPATDEKQKDTKQEIAELSFQLKLAGIGISIISTTEDRRMELLYLNIKGIEAAILNTNLSQVYQFRIKYANCDQNSQHESFFPVLLAPLNPKELLDPDSNNYFIDILIQRNIESLEIPYYKSIQLLLSGVAIRLDVTFIQEIVTFSRQLNEIFSKNADLKDDSYAKILMSEGRDEEKERLKSKEYFENTLKWKNDEIAQNHDNLFIEDLQIHPIFLNLSFKFNSHGIQMKKKRYFALKLLTNALGSTLANLDEAPLHLKGIQLSNVFDDQNEIVKVLGKKYAQDGIKQTYKILGSIDVIGNPVGLFRNISSGVVDLIEKPIQGFNQGPLEGGMGIIAGAESLVRNTISGTFNSIYKVTGSLAEGLSSITMDDAYNEQREREKIERPRDILEGLEQGLKSLASGVGEGISGVVLKPFEGAKKGGFKGFFKGTWQGISGLIFKPVAGVLDAAAKTSEGIKNNATSLDDKPRQNRQRYPRAFYGKEQFYRPYHVLDAEVTNLLQMCCEGEFADMSLLHSFIVFPNNESSEEYDVLILCVERVLYWSTNKAELVWDFPTADFEKATQTPEGVYLHLKNPPRNLYTKIVKIENSDESENELIIHKLNEVKMLMNN